MRRCCCLRARHAPAVPGPVHHSAGNRAAAARGARQKRVVWPAAATWPAPAGHARPAHRRHGCRCHRRWHAGSR
ncbi:hypothetical protein G6F54_014545 [Rhizopus delemar]|nr:hypothetical protein G6F23_015760 [Rhizopus arrhizus]KAG1470048.1 hypothetical protein G6F54_014545 [Rhizopus delemar]